MTTIKNFCIENEIMWFPIKLIIGKDASGKTVKELGEIRHPCYFNPEKHNFKATQNDFANVTSEKIEERQRLFGHVCTHIAMDTRKIFHIDIDEPKYNAEFDEIAQKAPYFTSTTKSYGKHIMVQNSTFLPIKKRHQFYNFDENDVNMGGVELLCGQWSYAPADGEMFNSDIPILQLDELRGKLSGYGAPVHKVAPVKHTVVALDTPIEAIANSLVVDADVRKYNEYAKLITFMDKGDYDKWYLFQLASFNINMTYDTYKEVVKLKGGYDEENNRKVWDKNDANHNKKVGWTTIIKMAGIDNPDEKAALDKLYKKKERENKKAAEYESASDNCSVVFKRLSTEFEKTHAKIKGRSLFVEETPTTTNFFTKPNLITSYEHMKCGVNIHGNPQTFIKMWLTCNDDIRCYDDMGVYPNKSLCPPTMYNLWRPFEMEKYTEPYEANHEALQFYLNHIKILCGNEQLVADYIVAWIAQMIQYPEVKTIMPTFIAAEGTGKSSFIIMLSRMMGASKILETTSPSRDVWGEFNGLMGDAFFVHLSEISKKEFQDSQGKAKGLITDATLNINKKSIGQYTINSYHRFIATTNNDDSIPTQKGDRRNLVIRCSDEKKGDTEYFNTMYKYLDDINVIRTLYDYFKNIPNMDKFNKIPMPKTEYQEDMKASNRSPIEMWLEDFTREHGNEVDVIKKGDEVFTLFKSWVSLHNMSYEVNSIKFMVRLKNLNIDGITTKSTKICNLKVFNIAKMKVHFGIDDDISSDCNTDDEEEEEFIEG